MDCGVVITTTKLRGKQILNTKNKKMAKETFESTYKVGSIEERLYTTICNLKHPAQNGRALWDDIEKLEHVLGLLALGKKIDSPFRFLTEKEYKKVFSNLQK